MAKEYYNPALEKGTKEAYSAIVQSVMRGQAAKLKAERWRETQGRWSRDECEQARKEMMKNGGKDAPWLVGESQAIMSVWPAIRLAAQNNEPVFITGDTGTGKELVAQLVHLGSERRGSRLVARDCGAFSRDDKLLSEIFGHVAGAFTGATKARRGALRAAAGGSLFLDELGNLPPEGQAKLLRVVEQNEVLPLGADEPERVDVRIISATNRDMTDAGKRQGLREDLLARMCVFEIVVPPLSQRLDDIPLLVAHFAKAKNRHVQPRPEWVEQLKQEPWPQNVRQLRNLVWRAVAMHDETAFSWPENPPPKASELTGAELEQVLSECGGNKTQAAEKLGISRSRLYKLLERHCIK